MLLCVCMCVYVWGRFSRLPASHVPLALVLSQISLLPSQWAVLHHASTPTSSQQWAGAAGSVLVPWLSCEGLPWKQPRLSLSPWSTETALFLSALRLPQTGFSWFRSPSIKAFCCNTASETHRQKQCDHLPGSTATLYTELGSYCHRLIDFVKQWILYCYHLQVDMC